MPCKLTGWGGNKSSYWCKILHIITHTRQWYVPSYFFGWTGDKESPKRVDLLLVDFTTNKLFDLQFTIMTGGLQLMELLENAFFRRWLVQCLVPFFDKDPLVWDQPICVNRYTICPFYLAQNCDMIGKCPTTREFDDGIRVFSRRTLFIQCADHTPLLSFFYINDYPLINNIV